MLTSAACTAERSQESFWGPTGSDALSNASGSVDRNAKRFTMIRVDPPQDFANPMHRRIVGSSRTSSAVDGFNPMNTTVLPSADQRRVRMYLYRPSGDITAAGQSVMAATS